eukprot:TRINITY_DN40767_c0_g1_i1.p1 TRINITY_DN40767_c0_g1~~TRINITY_DN40767_c0_g1_i1.p1  ORF type:complete len:476 (-),score=83.74 TRINITY_DN40767_c0_g1_i1:73-1311(-)
MAKGLSQLQALLADLSRSERRFAVDRLSVSLRSALIAHMEGFGRCKATKKHKSEPLPRSGNTPRSAAEVALAKVLPAPENISSVCPWPKRLKHSIGLPSASPNSSGTRRVHMGSVSAIKVGKGTKYMARMTIYGISVNSRCLNTAAEAEDLRGLLASLLQELLKQKPSVAVRAASSSARKMMQTQNCPDGLYEDQLLEAVFGLHQTEEVVAAAHKAGIALERLEAQLWTFRVVVDVRAWAGRILTSRSFTSISEALRQQRLLRAARSEGWESLRATWAECMSHRKDSNCSRSAGSPCSRLARLDAHRAFALQLKDQAVERRQKKCIERQKAQSKRLENRISRLASCLERQLQAEIRLRHAGSGPPRRKQLRKSVAALGPATGLTGVGVGSGVVDNIGTASIVVGHACRGVHC